MLDLTLRFLAVWFLLSIATAAGATWVIRRHSHSDDSIEPPGPATLDLTRWRP